MWGVFYLNARYAEAHRAVSVVLFMLFGNLGINVLGPAWYVVRVRGEPISEIGLSLRHWWLSLAISFFVAAFSWPELLRVAGEAQLRGDALARQVLFNGLVFWEVFFVFGWLQLRFERAFGIVPAIGLAALGFATYHVGTLPLEGVIGLAGFGVMFATLFRVTRSVLSLIPFAWAITSSIGTIRANFLATWNAVGAYAVVLAIQLSGLAWIARKSPHGPNPGSI